MNGSLRAAYRCVRTVPCGMANPQAGNGLLIIERILRDRSGIWDQIVSQRELRPLISQMLSSSVVSLALYGAVLGASNGWLQALSSLVKLPLLFLATLAICLPTLYLFNLVFGAKLSMVQAVALIMVSITVTAVLTLAFAPISLFFLITAQSYAFFKLLNVAILLLTAVVGLRFLVEGMRTLNEREMALAAMAPSVPAQAAAADVVAAQPVTAPELTAPDAVAPNAVAPNAVAPNAVAPNAVAPNAVAPNGAVGPADEAPGTPALPATTALPVAVAAKPATAPLPAGFAPQWPFPHPGPYPRAGLQAPRPTRVPAGQRPASMGLLYIWIVLFGFVGTQLAWTLRPFFGDPGTPFGLFREIGGTFYADVFRTIGNLFGG